MEDINRVTLTGRLTRDPELRATQSGTPVCSFGIAVNGQRKNHQTGEWEDVPNFFDCTIWGARGEALSRILHKGVKVAVAGRLRFSQWEKDGQKRSKVEVFVDDLIMMDGKKQTEPDDIEPDPYDDMPY